MSHFDIVQWADFVRGLFPVEQQNAMQAHLNGGCAACGASADILRGMVQVCSTLRGYELPEASTKWAEGIFPARPAFSRRTVRIPFDIIFDSSLMPVPVGLRTARQVGWQSVYRAGDYSLDLRAEPDMRSAKVALVGQISNQITPGNRLSNIPVYVCAGREIVAQTLSTQFGEFQMDYEHKGRLRLRILLENGSKSIQVPLKKLSAERPVGRDRSNLQLLLKTDAAASRPGKGH